MSGFAVDWLDLREPADRRARNAGLLADVARHFGSRETIAVVDLACGTGATLRAVGPVLPSPQSWYLVDHDAALLGAADARCRAALPAGHRIEWRTQRADLQDQLEAVLALPADLLTMSALLDLVSSAWLDRLADAAAARRLPIYAALTYSGNFICEPADPFDERIREAFNAHQGRDKGFGPTMAPFTMSHTMERLAVRGFDIRQAESDWALDAGDARLQAEVLHAWHRAVREHGVLDQSEVDRWLARRLDWLEQGRSCLVIRHADLWAYPAPVPRSRSNSRSPPSRQTRAGGRKA